jgi:hypothetical protein
MIYQSMTIVENHSLVKVWLITTHLIQSHHHLHLPHQLSMESLSHKHLHQLITMDKNVQYLLQHTQVMMEGLCRFYILESAKELSDNVQEHLMSI